MTEKRKPFMKVSFATGMGQYSEDCLQYLEKKRPDLSFVPFDKELHDCEKSVTKHVNFYKEWNLSIPDWGYEFVSRENLRTC